MHILPKVRDPRLITIRRGGPLTDEDHHLLAEWAALCAKHVIRYFEAAPVVHLAAHALGAAAYAIRAADAADSARIAERDWQRERIPDPIRALVLDDQSRRSAICWNVFDD